MNNVQTLTAATAYKAMQRFLQSYWERGRSEEIAMLLGSLSIQADGSSADPAMRHDWERACREAVADEGR